jgi:regulator of sirC expression with transglutaminase-like and TPR domain
VNGAPPTDRYLAVVASDDESLRLDEAALCIAAHAHPALDVDAWLGRIDELAARCDAPTFDAVREELFVHQGFTGDVQRYHDPENSFLDSVIERRLGIPITLSVLVIAVARRLGVRVHGVGMPGHFLVQLAGDDDRWCDPFHGGALLDLEGCRRRFDALFGGTRPFGRADLAPTPPRLVVARMLANLEHGPLARDPLQLAWMCELHLAIPGVPLAERVAVLHRLARVTDPVRAALAFDALADLAGASEAAALRDEARRLRARMN